MRISVFVAVVMTLALSPLAQAQFKNQKISTANQLLQAKVPAKSVKLEEEPDYIFMELDVESNDSVYCELYADGIDIAASQQAIVEAIIEEGLESTAMDSKLQAKVRHVGMVEDSVVMETLWLFTEGKDSEQLMRMSTASIERPDGSGFVCWNASNFSPDAFAGLVNVLAKTAKVNVSSAQSFYRDVVKFHLQDQLVGYGYNQLSRDEENDIRALSGTAMLIAVQPGVVSAADSQKVEWASPNGDLINTYSIETDGGNVVSELSFEPADKADEWLVKGQLQGKKVELPVKTSSTVKSDIELLRAQYALLSKKDGTEYAYPVWLPESPDKIQIASIRRVNKKGKHVNMKAALGGLKLDAKFTANGKHVALNLKMGHIAITGESIFIEGRP